MAEKTVEELQNKLVEICKQTKTSLEGMMLLKNYYITSLKWDEKKAIEYCIGLFDNGTIAQIKLLGKDGKEI